MSLQPKTFNTQHPTSNIQVTDAGKLGGSALNACSRDSGVEGSMFVREISPRATIWPDSRVEAGILPGRNWRHPCRLASRKTAQKLLYETMEITL